MNRCSHILLQVCLPVLLCVAGCGRKPADSGLPTRSFPEVRAPGMYTMQEDVIAYVLDHFWDSYLDTTAVYLCDSVYVAGVKDKDLATQLASYLKFLQELPVDKSDILMRKFFRQLDSYQAARPESNVFDRMVEAVDYYLYDPNSQLRDEDLYLPFVSELSVSKRVNEDKKVDYSYRADMCSMNCKGTMAADFSFVDTDGRLRNLYGEKAPCTVVIFINPGCKACKDAVAAFSTGRVLELVSMGALKIFGIYIDEDIDKWNEEVAHLPSHWICGYDPDFEIRQNSIYNVRAIPSIYVLDQDKRVIFKDATPQRANYFVEQINQ